MIRLSTLTASVFLLTACSQEPNTSTPLQATEYGASENEGSVVGTAMATGVAGNSRLVSGVEQEHFDVEVEPGDDFYRYVNGSWLESNEIPPDRSNFGIFTVLADTAEDNLHDLIEEAQASNSEVGSERQKVGDFYASFMATEQINELGIAPIREALDNILLQASKQDLLAYAAQLNRLGVQLPISFYVNVDAGQSDQYITYLNQSGLGLPERDWYLSEDNERHSMARSAYRDYIGKLMSLSDYEHSDRMVESVMGIEQRLAEAHWDRVRNRQQELTYNKMTLSQLRNSALEMDWSLLMQNLGITESTVIVRQPDYMTALAAIWEDVPLSQWQDYFSFKLVDAYADYLGEEFVTASFDFHGRVLSGVEEMRPRWKRAVTVLENTLGEILGQLYVERYFQEESKQRMDELVVNLRAAFREGIDELDWMTTETKTRAQEKLNKFVTKIGYPEEWKDYSALVVKADDLIGNIKRSQQVEHEREIAKLGGAIDRGEWFMTPQTVNAYYNPTMNEIVFPAAILQPPFFNVAADDAVNYGAIGAVIGHELSHGFDDQGRKFDGDGNLRDWWTEADAAAFADLSADLVAQYATFEVLPGQFLDAEFTLGENIGDLSGLAVAHRAWRMSLDGQEAPTIDGLTGQQRFFIGWAQVWRRLYRDEDLAQRLTNDPHSHSEARTNGVVRNFDAWYEAFDVREDHELYLPPAARVQIW